MTSKTPATPKRRSRSATAPAATSEGNAAPPEVLPAALPDEVIASTVSEVNELARQATLELSVQLGKLVVERFYANDLGAWRARGTSDASFRKLSAHPDLVVSPSGLYRAVAVYELCERLVNVSGLKHLAVGHFRAVLGLADKHQEKLLTTASEKGWKVEKVEDEAAKIRKKEGDGRGRRPDPGFVKGIRRMDKLLAEDGGWFDDLEKVEDLEADEAEALWKTVTGMKLKCEELQKKLASRVPGFE